MSSIDLQFLAEQGISQALIKDIEVFRQRYPLAADLQDRAARPQMTFFGKAVLEMAITAVIQGENLLLSGSKATGKNLLAENLAYIFGRPVYDISFHVNTDSSSLIGTDTFRDNQVQLRQGPVYQCAVTGGFGILDEINMAKNDAVSVLHSVLDDRKIIDVPGYDRISLHPACRFIATMNYGYAGTRELNEALVSRFMVINMPDLTEAMLEQIIKAAFPDIKKEAVVQLSGLIQDLQTKAMNGEMSTKAMDLRGLLGALKMMRGGLSPRTAIAMGITNKSFDLFEREMIEDLVMTRIPESWTGSDIFNS